MPRPKSCAQIRLTATRAVSGLSGLTSHFATPRRLSGAPAGNFPKAAGTAGLTASPFIWKLPSVSIVLVRCLFAASSTMTGTRIVPIAARCDRSSAIAMRSGSPLGMVSRAAIMASAMGASATGLRSASRRVIRIPFIFPMWASVRGWMRTLST